ncbi:MAG: hypothetical protein MI924_37010 [Chloroflexales bacterium]|nr:hypothetical protein [Chloroflexales bacterium]
MTRMSRLTTSVCWMLIAAGALAFGLSAPSAAAVLEAAARPALNAGPTYYVDAVDGNDLNDGRSPDQA